MVWNGGRNVCMHGPDVTCRRWLSWAWLVSAQRQDGDQTTQISGSGLGFSIVGGWSKLLSLPWQAHHCQIHIVFVFLIFIIIAGCSGVGYLTYSTSFVPHDDSSRKVLLSSLNG